MAESNIRDPYTLKAAVNLSANIYQVMRLSAANACNIASNAVDSDMVGVLQNKPEANEAATIADSGLSKIMAGGALSVGDPLTCNGSGRAAAVTSGQVAFGRLLEAAGGDGDIVTCRLFPPVRWSGAV